MTGVQTCALPICFPVTIVGYNPNFDSKQYEYLDNGEAKTKSYIKQIEEAQPTLTNIDAVLSNGLLDREAGDFRSYYQKPYVYFNKIVQQVIEQMKTLIDYTIELDTDFFKEIELQAIKQNFVQMLPYFIKKNIDENTQLETPEKILLTKNNNRSELKLFDAQKQLLETQRKIINTKNTPKLGAFFTGGYGDRKSVV